MYGLNEHIMYEQSGQYLNFIMEISIIFPIGQWFWSNCSLILGFVNLRRV